jgi:hypothetical protein
MRNQRKGMRRNRMRNEAREPGPWYLDMAPKGGTGSRWQRFPRQEYRVLVEV